MSLISKPLNLVTLLLLFAFGVSILPISLAEILQPVQAQTNETQQTEAERLLKLCREDLSKNQPEAAIQSCQQAVTATLE
jgi:hypothetical protein